jgi:uncharacterized membrane protein HdeD (DUF308 family)
MLLVDGIMLVLLGAVDIIGVNPGDEDVWLVRIFGGVLCVVGVFLGARLWVMTRDRELHAMLWLMSIVPVVLGVILLVWPVQSKVAILTILAVGLLIRGAVEGSVALGRRSRAGWQFLLAHGIAAIVIGAMFWIQPSLAVVLLILFMGIDLIMHGTRNISTVRRLRQQLKSAASPGSAETHSG